MKRRTWSNYKNERCFGHDGWAKLAAAIIQSGKHCNDTKFLKSNWHDMLLEMCRLDDILNDKNTHILG